MIYRDRITQIINPPPIMKFSRCTGISLGIGWSAGQPVNLLGLLVSHAVYPHFVWGDLITIQSDRSSLETFFL